jgi:tRNA-splicing ligase RtcB
MAEESYEILEGGRVPIYAWTKGVLFEAGAKLQLLQTAQLDFIHDHIAVMPDVHYGRGSTVGSVIPTLKAIIPAAVGVDIGCGMVAVRTSLTADRLPSNVGELLFDHISAAVPVGSAAESKKGQWDKIPGYVNQAWGKLQPGFEEVVGRHGRSRIAPVENQLGTLGGGNHFIEICLDEEQQVWIMLHSGSRGVGNKIGTHFTELAKKDMERLGIGLPNRDLAYFKEGSEHFDEYVQAVHWCQEYARTNRDLMLRTVVDTMRKSGLPKFTLTDEAVNCHHNYVQLEDHFGERVWVTRKGAVSAQKDQLGIIPGSMGAKSFIVRGKGNPQSFNSCAHGAGRQMSRGDAKRQITLSEHREATEGIACRKDKGVIDESPRAYKSIDEVMVAQDSLVDIIHTLKQFCCVKG